MWVDILQVAMIQETSQKKSLKDIANMKDKIKYAMTDSFNNGNYKVLDDLFSENAAGPDKAQPEGKRGAEGAKELIKNFREAFPDIHVEVESQIEEGDKIATMWKMSGTHKGKFMGKEATNKKVKISACSVDRISDGKVVEYNTYRDDLRLMQQIERA